MNHKVGALKSSREMLEKTTMNLKEELMELTSKVDGMSLDLQDNKSQVKMQSKMIDAQRIVRTV